MKLFKATCYVVLLSVCAACLRLSAVQQYADESQTGIHRFDEVSLGFRDLCQRKRQVRDLRRGQAQRTYQDSCVLHRQADSALLTMQSAITAYLSTLSAVSSGERRIYDLSPAADALSNSGLVTWEEGTVGAYQNLLELLATAATETYRRQQVEALVADAHEPLTILLDQFSFAVDESLREAIEQQQEMLYLNTLELADSAQTFVERRGLWQEYVAQSDYYARQLELLNTYAALINTIRQGHQHLYNQRERLDRTETIATTAFYLRQLRDLQQAFAATSTD